MNCAQLFCRHKMDDDSCTVFATTMDPWLWPHINRNALHIRSDTKSRARSNDWCSSILVGAPRTPVTTHNTHREERECVLIYHKTFGQVRFNAARTNWTRSGCISFFRHCDLPIKWNNSDNQSDKFMELCNRFV